MPTTGDDIIIAVAGNQTIDGLAGTDLLDMQNAGINGANVDLVSGFAVSAGTGIDTISNIENLKGSDGDDTLAGNGGNNVFVATAGTDGIDGREGVDTFDASAATAGVTINLAEGEASGTAIPLTSSVGSGAFTADLTSIENAVGGSGGDTLTGSTASNTLVGNGGVDTVIIDEAILTDAVTQIADADPFTVGNQAGWQIETDTNGTDTLAGVEIVQGTDGNILLVGNGGFATIQEAIDAAEAGDTIFIAAGTYEENVVVDVEGLTITGVGEVTIQGTFETDNSVTGDLSEWIKTHTYTGDAGAGITIAADGVTVSNVNIDDFLHGVLFNTDVTSTALTDIDVNDSVIGIEKSTTANIDGLTLTGGSFTDGYIGIDFAKATGAGQEEEGLAENVTIDGTHFEDMTAKGIYVEALSHSTITGVTMTNVGFWGSGAAFGGPYAGVGIEINLKNGEYSDITITDFTLTDTGTSAHDNSGAISVKTRDDSPSYNSQPATWVGDPLVISDGTIDGTTTGIRAGETGKNVEGPDVDVSGVDIIDALHNAQNGDVENLSQSPMNVELTDDPDTLVVSQQSTGVIIVDAGDGNDTITGAGGNETMNGGEGDDAFHAGGGIDTAIFDSEAASLEVIAVADADANTVGDQAGWQVETGTEGTNSLTDVEVLQGTDGDILLVGNGGFATIQEAIDVAENGDTIMVAAGTYEEQIVIDGKDITIEGAGIGETIILSPDAADLELSHVETNSGTPNRYSVVTITNDADVTIEGVTVDGNDQGAIPTSSYNFSGIYVINSDATIDSVEVTGIRETVSGELSGNQRNHAIVATSHDGAHGGNGPHTVTIENSVISDFQKTGIFANGPDLTINILDNEIQGTQTEFQTQNGIQIGTSGAFAGTTAHIEGNTITDIGFSDETTTNPNTGGATGILTFNAGLVEIIDNTISGYADLSTNPNYQNNGIVFLDTEGGVVEDNDISGFDNAIGDLDAFGLPNHNTAEFTHDGNTYTDNGNNILLDPNPDGTTPVSFEGSSGDDILNGASAGDELSGLGGDDAINGRGGTDDLSGGDGEDALDGGGSNDTLDGGDDDDTLEGGDGIDTAEYDATIDLSDISGGSGEWTVTTGGSEGTDTLTGVEILNGDGDGRILLVGSGGFATIQEAIDAAAEGDTILIAEGTYNESLTIDTGVTLVGQGEVVIDGVGTTVVEITGDLDGGDVTLSNLELVGTAAAPNQGIGVLVQPGADVGTLTLEDVEIRDNGAYGVFVNGETTGEEPAANVVITDSTFTNNGYNGANGSAHIKLFSYAGDALIQDVTITGAAPGTVSTSGTVPSAPDYGIEFHGLSNTEIASDDAPSIGTVVIEDVTVTGDFHKKAVAINNYADLDDLSIDGLDLSGAVVAQVVNWFGVFSTDGIASDIDASQYDITLPAGVIATELSGDTPAQGPVNQTITGTDARDRIMGKGGDDVLHGGEGDDELYGHDKPGGNSVADTGNDQLFGEEGNDTLSGGAGNDTLDGGTGGDGMAGGDGNDTYVVDEAVDTVTESSNQGTTDLVQSSVDYTLSDNIENLTLTGSAVNGTGNSLNNVITGNGEDNTLDGDSGDDTLNGGVGVDALFGGNHNDTLNGGTESDVLVGGAGNDTLDGGSGADLMLGGTGDDTFVVDEAGDIIQESNNQGTDLVQSAITYTLASNLENLTLTGSASIDGTGNTAANTITGNSGVNVLNGNSGNDTLSGGADNDTLNGGNDDDTLNGGAGNDGLHGGGGNDTASYAGATAGVTVSLSVGGPQNTGGAGTDTLSSIERLTGSSFVDTLTGDGGDNILSGGNGNDTLKGEGGSDRLDGGVGADNMQGGLGNDTYVVDGGSDIVTEAAGAGTDTVESSVTHTLAANVENLTLTGTAGTNGTGNNLANTITGNAGVNRIDGGAGSDTMAGGNGNDTYVVDSVADVVTEASGAGTGVDTVEAALTHTLAANVENLTLTGTAGTNGTGNALNNTIIGNSGINIIDGGAGGDKMQGGLGNDFYVVDNASDQVIEAAGAGTDTVQSSVTHTLAANVEKLTLTGSSAINGTGNSLNNTLIGNSGANRLDGDALGDTLTGGGGSDRFVFDDGDGADTVTDYEDGSDQFDLTAVAAVDDFGDLTIIDNGATVTVNYGAGSFTITNLPDPGQLDAGDFLF